MITYLSSSSAFTHSKTNQQIGATSCLFQIARIKYIDFYFLPFYFLLLLMREQRMSLVKEASTPLNQGWSLCNEEQEKEISRFKSELKISVDGGLDSYG